MHLSDSWFVGCRLSCSTSSLSRFVCGGPRCLSFGGSPIIDGCSLAAKITLGFLIPYISRLQYRCSTFTLSKTSIIRLRGITLYGEWQAGYCCASDVFICLPPTFGRRTIGVRVHCATPCLRSQHSDVRPWHAGLHTSKRRLCLHVRSGEL